jgi:hypothetical protein
MSTRINHFTMRPLTPRSAHWLRIGLRLLGMLAWLLLAFLWLLAPGCSGARLTPTPIVTIIPIPTTTPPPTATVAAVITTTNLLPTNKQSASSQRTGAPLPAPLYFLNPQGQIMRLAADGVTVQPVTNEAAPITAFDVDPTGAYVVYVRNNDLIRINAWGQERHLLLRGGTPGEAGTSAQFINTIFNVAFAPDGKQLAFGRNGIQLIRDITVPDPITTAETLLANGPEPELPPGAHLYFLAPGVYPSQWSPDGKRMFVTTSRMSTDSSAHLILDVTTRQIADVTITPPVDQGTEQSRQSGLLCYTAGAGSTQRWDRASMALFTASDYYAFLGPPGLTTINATDGTVTPLLYAYPACHTETTAENPTQLRLFRSIYQSTTGALWGFVSTSYDPERPNVTLMTMAQFDLDRAQITPLRADSHYLGHEILWAEDDRGAVVIVRKRVGDELNHNQGQLLWLPSDGTPALDLGLDGRWLRWGGAVR